MKNCTLRKNTTTLPMTNRTLLFYIKTIGTSWDVLLTQYYSIVNAKIKRISFQYYFIQSENDKNLSEFNFTNFDLIVLIDQNYFVNIPNLVETGIIDQIYRKVENFTSDLEIDKKYI